MTTRLSYEKDMKEMDEEARNEAVSSIAGSAMNNPTNIIIEKNLLTDKPTPDIYKNSQRD